MPLGGKALKKRQQAADAANGVIRDAKVLEKMAKAKADVKCMICGQIFKLTKKNVDARNHAASKHPKETFAACFPEIVAAEAEEANLYDYALNAASGGGGEAPAGKKKEGKKKKKKDDLNDLLGAGLEDLSIGKKKANKK